MFNFVKSTSNVRTRAKKVTTPSVTVSQDCSPTSLKAAFNGPARELILAGKESRVIAMAFCSESRTLGIYHPTKAEIAEQKKNANPLQLWTLHKTKNNTGLGVSFLKATEAMPSGLSLDKVYRGALNVLDDDAKKKTGMSYAVVLAEVEEK